MTSALRFLGVLVGLVFLFLALSFKRIHTLELGLDYNQLTQEVSPQPLANGMHFLGAPWHRLLIFPKTMQNMQFSTNDSPHDELHTRTMDGLQVVLEISFQYQFLPDEVHALFEDFGEDGYKPVFFDVAAHLISEAATEYTAYQFFNQKETIASKMCDKLDAYFRAELHASVVSLQIQSSQLPDSFNEAITDTVTQRQNITNAQKYVDQMMVSLETDVIVAQKRLNATVAVAHAVAQQIALGAEAQATVASQNARSEATSYANAKARLGFSNEELLRYVWWDSIESTNGDDASLLIGVSPSTLLTQPNVDT